MSEDDLYFRNDLTYGIEATLKQFGLQAVTFTWNGQGFAAIAFPPLETAPGDLTFDAACAAGEIQQRITNELQGSYPENRGVPFRYNLDLVADTCSLLWGLED